LADTVYCIHHLGLRQDVLVDVCWWKEVPGGGAGGEQRKYELGLKPCRRNPVESSQARRELTFVFCQETSTHTYSMKKVFKD
jgi:hypothetical protein